VLLKELKIAPAIAVGHSAGAAIIVRMVVDGHIAPKAAVSLNGALMPFPGLAAVAFPFLAKILFLNPFAAPVATRMAMAPEAVERLLGGTGSDLGAESLAFYAMLFRNRPHVEATLGMMANWDLQTLKFDLRRLSVPLTLVSAENDTAVPPRVGLEVKRMLPAARHITLSGQGHLAHEVVPATVVEIIQAAAAA
jgi:magnesium chelatase accessory protein